MNIQEIRDLKTKRKSTWITCYDYPSALIASKTNIDGVLIGDSLAMTVYGHDSTLTATTQMIAQHTKAVAKGLKGYHKHIVADLPFLTYQGSFDRLLKHVTLLMQSGAHSLKLEGADESILKHIQKLTQNGVPIMGHLGLTPQSIHTIGGYKVQGKTQSQYIKILNDAKKLEQAGCFCLVLECVPDKLANEITNSLEIPTIGIGAGSGTDGQILVWHDLLGYPSEHKPKFVRSFMNTQQEATAAIEAYINQIQNIQFPLPSESYKI